MNLLAVAELWLESVSCRQIEVKTSGYSTTITANISTVNRTACSIPHSLSEYQQLDLRKCYAALILFVKLQGIITNINIKLKSKTEANSHTIQCVLE
jgi:hypothetical protein